MERCRCQSEATCRISIQYIYEMSLSESVCCDLCKNKLEKELFAKPLSSWMFYQVKEIK
jgi:hypothetical protein